MTAVTIEGDWPDAYRVNLFVRGESDDESADEALSDFRRFPAWMWRNAVVLDFVTWLREWNDSLPRRAPKVGFYGLDLYSLHASMSAVVEYLDEVDPGAAARARERYSCFDHFGEDAQAYAYATARGGAEPCEEEVVAQLVELHARGARSPVADADREFAAEQNARLVVDAERYYRAMFRGGGETWNLRDRHMADTLDALVAHLDRTQPPTKAVVWAHNSHVGDARATQLGRRGELNVGELVRERHGLDTRLVGFTTYCGTVTAASSWGGRAERKRVRRALPESWEELFHERGDAGPVALPAGRRLERAIGVVYRPETERMSHYFHADVSRQFDAVVHLDETRAVEPLERTSEWDAGALPETYPFAV